MFQTLNLPVERGESRSSSDSSGGKPPLAPPPPTEPESYSYVQLTAMHDYMYPVVEGEGSLKKRAQLTPPHKRKERCRHCQVLQNSSSYAFRKLLPLFMSSISHALCRLWSLPANRGGRVCVAWTYLNSTSHSSPLFTQVGSINNL